MRLAAIKKVYIVIRKGKWDLPGYLRDGKMLNMHLAYLMMDLPFGVPYTLDQAYPFVQDAMVAFGFPDIIFQPKDAFVRLLARQAESNADIVLGLFTANHPHKIDMVDQEPDGRICEIQIKPARTNLRYGWLIAVWTPDFTCFMHDYVTESRKRKNVPKSVENDATDQELFVGDVIQSAIEHDMPIDSVVFSQGKYLDIGTPEDIVKAIQIKI
jgi:glucose-1-phosphate thymidylyltransferase